VGSRATLVVAVALALAGGGCGAIYADDEQHDGGRLTDAWMPQEDRPACYEFCSQEGRIQCVGGVVSLVGGWNFPPCDETGACTVTEAYRCTQGCAVEPCELGDYGYSPPRPEALCAETPPAAVGDPCSRDADCLPFPVLPGDTGGHRHALECGLGTATCEPVPPSQAPPYWITRCAAMTVTFPCTPGAPLGCEADAEVDCNATGDGVTTQPCAFGCSAAATRCNSCTPNAIECHGNLAVACNYDGAIDWQQYCTLGCHLGAAPGCICPANMVYVFAALACVDAYEASAGGGGVAQSAPGVAPWAGVTLDDAQQIKPQARTLAVDRGIRCLTLDYDMMRGMDSDEYRLF
jgi:hypothetical protein